MFLNFIILFLSGLLPGLAVFFLPNFSMQRFKLVLAFSGSYLFSITVIHILPEIMHEANDLTLVGIFVLAGFFLQMILEYFTAGVEHGHIHAHEHELHHGHHIPWSMFISLSIHAFLEGTLLFHPTHAHHTEDVQNLLFGLVLHKIPEAFALMSVLVFSVGKRAVGITLLLLFSFASPIGLWCSTYFYSANIIDGDLFIYVFAVVGGIFLYISTTIFFETSPQHKFKPGKLIISVFGAVCAILAEYLL